MNKIAQQSQKWLPIVTFCFCLYLACDTYAQPSNGSRITLPSRTTLNIADKDGRFFADLKAYKIGLTDQVQQLHTSFGLSDQYTFSLIQEDEDVLGFSHSAYQQHFKGIPIEDGLVLLHAKNAVMTSFNGIRGKLPEEFSVQPLIAQSQAIIAAHDALDLRDQYHQPEVRLVISRSVPGNEYVLTYKVYLEGITKEGIYTRMNVFVDAGTGKVRNKISLIANAAVQGTAHTLYSGIQEITMDSYRGSYRLRDELRGIVTMNFDKATVTSSGIVDNLSEYTNASTTWADVMCLDSVRLFTIGDTNLVRNSRYWTPAVFINGEKVAKFPIQGPVKDNSKPDAAPFVFPNIGYSLLLPPYLVTMATYNSTYTQSSGKAFFYIDSAAITEGSHSWSDTLGNSGLYTIRKRGNPALDAHWGMARTYDYFKETFGRYSYDGRKGPITNLINGSYNFTGSQANAAALNNGANGLMVFGLGDRYKMNDVVCLDVLGHEFAHMVTYNNGHGGLVYQGESGALNESFSDIFGTCIEFYAKKPVANWTMGDEAFLIAPFMYRSLAEPKLTNSSNTYQGQHWINPMQTNNDNGGVHYNSGVQNRWFYLLCEGGTGTNDKSNQYDVKSIGMDKAQQIAYRNLTTYLTPYATYIDAYHGSLQATEDLYGGTGPEMEAVRAAWFAVGLDAATTNLLEVTAITDVVDIYPNPASDNVNVSIKVSKQGKVMLSLKDIMGKTVLQQAADLPTVGEQHLQMDIRSLADGIYFLEIGNGPHSIKQKITVQH